MNVRYRLMGQPLVIGALCIAAILNMAGCNTASVQNENTSAIDVTRRTEETEERKRARIRLELAINYYRERNLSVALDELRKAIQIDSNYADAYGVLALVYNELGERTLAEENYHHALRLSPNDSHINNNYGWFLCQTGREAESIQYFNRALRNPLYETPAQPLQNAGICSFRINDLKSAEDYLKRSFELNPGSIATMDTLAKVYYKKAEYERSKFYIERILRQAEPTAEILWLAVRVEHKLGDRLAETVNATQLHNRYPQSKEYAKYLNGTFDE